MEEGTPIRVAWRRAYARQYYVGQLTHDDGAIRLVGRECGSRIDAAISIKHGAVTRVRVGAGRDEELVGEPAVVLELDDGDPILVRPVGTGELELAAFAETLRAAGAGATRPGGRWPAHTGRALHGSSAEASA